MADFLRQMGALGGERAEQARAAHSEVTLRHRIADGAPPRSLRPSPFQLFAEFKRSSPSAGNLDRGSLDPRERVLAYARGGASAISVLTEPSSFHGSTDDLREISELVSIPTMRKDFLVDPYQLLEARACGASGALLIVKLLIPGVMDEMVSTVIELGMFALVECFDMEDLDRCHSLVGKAGVTRGNVLLGLNTRDLRDLSVRPSHLEELADAFPAEFTRVAESGLNTPDEVRQAAEWGYGGALVGSALMRSADPAALCRAMVDEGERAARVRATP